MNHLRSLLAVLRFEWRRSLTFGRIAWWCGLTLFAPTLCLLIRINAGQPPTTDPLAGVLFALIPGVVCTLGVFLWATPAVASELEAGSWTYLAVRPHGGSSVLLGKYLTAVSWTALAALVALFLSILILAPEEFLRFSTILGTLALLSCLAYSAVFVFIGVIIPRKAMVVAVVYSLVFELLIGFVPAVINRLTVQYRLRSLLVQWMEWDQLGGPPGQTFRNPVLYGDDSAFLHILSLFSLIGLLLTASIFVLRWKEFPTSGEPAN